MSNEKVFVGTSTVVFNSKNQILMGKRIYEPILGYSTPGGKIDFEETVFDCCKREAMEETGIEIENLEIKAVGENIFPDKGVHSITIFVFCRIKDNSVVKNMEPHKYAIWEWFDIDNLPEEELAFNYEAIFKDNKKLLRDYISR